jgi:hypothetical protein
VLVVGMHRSGTSALAGALGQLGFALPAHGDLVTGRPDNPVHNESRALNVLDDAVLEAAGGTWSAPPPLDEGWERAPAVIDVLGRAPDACRRAFPDDGAVAWKDPRLCLLLSLWRNLLPPPVTPVLLWRSPLAVARSLGTRQGFTVSHGLALWERYNRAALAQLAGSAAFVVDYEQLRRAPRQTIGELAVWLAARTGLADAAAPRAIDRAASTVSGTLARHEGDGAVPSPIDEMVGALRRVGGAHEQLPACSFSERPGWMADAIRQRRDYEDLYRRYLRYVKWRRRIPFVGHKAGRTPRRAD